jgi:hypothetical protein
MFQVFANCPETMGPGEIGHRAARAEAMGFDGLQVPDAIHDGLLLSAMALNATGKLIVSTGVLLAMTRDGNWADMAMIMSDEVMEKIIPRGTYEDIASVYRTRYGDLTTRITFPMPEDSADDHLAAAVVRQLQDN